MLSYKNNIRVSVLTALGRADVALPTTPNDEMEIDLKIIRLASRTLNKSELTTFFFAFHCCPSWEKIVTLFLESFNRELDLETVQRYGQRAVQKIKNEAPRAPELRK